MTHGNQARFEQTCRCLGVDAGISSNVWEKLAARYSEKHRHYHNLSHIGRMLADLDRIHDSNDVIEIAIWFHDSVYNPLAKDNETQSAALFGEFLGKHLSKILANDVGRLILATDPKLPRTGLEDENLLIDIDLGILGSTPDEYDQYRFAIREEYSVVPDLDFNKGRISVLEHILRNPIYVTPAFAGLESQARSNIGREIELLASQH